MNVYFSLGCVNCQDCFGCTNLKGKKFCFLNEQLTEADYHARLAEIDLQDGSVVEAWRTKIREEYWAKAARRGSYNPNSERVVGDDLHDC